MLQPSARFVPSTPRRQWSRWAPISIALLMTAAAHADPGASNASRLSDLPIAVSVEAPAALLSTGAELSVVAVEASADGTLYVLQRASDGARASLRLGARTVGGVSLAAGAVVTVTTLSAGWVLSEAGRAIAFVPNAVGVALFHNEQLTR